jgi:predicted alpha/beta-fold hydrolase
MTATRETWKFRVHPLLPNGHLQTVVGIQWPRRYAHDQGVRHNVSVSEGDQIVLHETFPSQTDDSLPIVLMIHGLGGCHMSSYMRRMVEKLTERGYHCFRMDMRGCGAGDVVAQRPTHCGRWQDVVAALNQIAELYPDRDTQIVGFSMGGTLTLNMLAEMGHMPVGNLQRSLAISPPIDLIRVEHSFRAGMGRNYDKFFVKLMWKQTLQRWKLHPETAPAEIPSPPRRLREYDELVTAPTGGFRSAQDYYERSSPGPKLATISQPVTIFSSEDDPVVSVGPLLDSARSGSTALFTTTHGGHLGFMAARSGDPDFRWLDWRILDWLGQSSSRPVGDRRRQTDRVLTT